MNACRTTAQPAAWPPGFGTVWCCTSEQAADFGPRTALKVVDGVRDQIMGGKLKTGDAIRTELKVPLLPQPGSTCCGPHEGPTSAEGTYHMCSSLHSGVRRVHSGRCAGVTPMWLTAQASIVRLLESRGGSTALDFGDARPGVLLIVGVNGGGKTTTIGKLAHKFVGEGATVRCSRSTPAVEFGSRSHHHLTNDGPATVLLRRR